MKMETGALISANLKLRQENEELKEVLRFLACYVGCGGYNAEEYTPDEFRNKIKTGIDLLNAIS